MREQEPYLARYVSRLWRVYWQDWLFVFRKGEDKSLQVTNKAATISKNKQEHLHLCSSGEFQMFPLLRIKQENKLLRKAYKDYFIDRFKPLLNQKL